LLIWLARRSAAAGVEIRCDVDRFSGLDVLPPDPILKLAVPLTGNLVGIFLAQRSPVHPMIYCTEISKLTLMGGICLIHKAQYSSI
jgi:hypothetical protein